MRLVNVYIILLSLISVISCANLQTIGRSTALPEVKENQKGQDGKGKGLAIHLDAQQRLVVVNRFQQFCAEPSPDAFSAYAASLGLGVSEPKSQIAASLAQALQSSSGSIGLRTQSITLMRDALYRMCEAYSNGAISEVQVATLLGRSQDLTAVILAVEQLTGAVAAGQVILTGTSSSSASANLISNQELLDAARKDEEDKSKSLEEAKKERDMTKEAYEKKNIEVKEADNKYKNAKDAEETELKADLDAKTEELDKIRIELETKEGIVKNKEDLLAEAKKNRETIQDLKDAASTNAIANTSSAGQFSVPVQRKQLSDQATQIIAEKVSGMVNNVVNKTYANDSCMALLTSPNKHYDVWTPLQRESYNRVQKLCMDIVSKNLYRELKKDSLSVGYGPDDLSNQIDNALSKDQSLQAKIEEWLKKNELDIQVTTLLYGSEYAEQRKKIIKDLNIQK